MELESPVILHVPDPILIVRTLEFDELNDWTVTLKLFAVKVPLLTVRLEEQEKASWSV